MSTTATRPSSTQPSKLRHHPFGPITRTVVVVATLAVATVGCSSGSDSGGPPTSGSTAAIQTADPKIPVPAKPDVAAVYVTLTNSSSQTDTLESVTTDAGGTAELHRTVTEGGSEMMRAAGPVDIDGGATLTLAPGGFHIMIMHPSRTLSEGDRVQVDLVFRRAGKVTFEAPVVPAADILGGGTGGHSSGDGNSGGH